MSDDFWSDLAEAAAEVVVTVAVDSVLQSAFSGKTKLEAGVYPQKQSLPPVSFHVGDYSKNPGAFVFYESDGGANFVAIQALHDGRADSFFNLYLNDDLITLDPDDQHVTSVTNGANDGRYVDGRVFIYTRLGEPTETAYSRAVSLFSGLWDNSCRGDGTASIMTLCISPESKFFHQAFPVDIPVTKPVLRGVCYDWRDGTQIRTDPSSWKWSANVVVWTVFLEWSRWGKDWDSRIAPVLSDLTAEADICDADQDLAAGGTEKRYRCAFNFSDYASRGDVRKKLRDCMDGFTTRDGRGHLVVKAGRYEEPSYTLAGRFCEGWYWSRGVEDENTVTQFEVSFMSPGNDFNVVACDPWLTGDGGKSEPLDLSGVPSFTQARRLAKRQMLRRNPKRSGWVKVPLPVGLNMLGQRYVRVQNPREASMADVVVEIIGARMDAQSGVWVFDIIQADASIDDWNPETEEGNPPPASTTLSLPTLANPTITSATPVLLDATTATIEVEASLPARTDITGLLQWKRSSDSLWTEVSGGTVTGSTLSMTTGVVPVNDSIDIQVAYITGGGATSGWSATDTVSTSTASLGPSPITSQAVTAGGSAGQANLSWRNSTSSNFDHVIIERATNSGMTAGLTTVLTRYDASGSTDSYTDTGLTTGTTYYYNFTAYNASGTASTTPSPSSVVAP